ncbi:MAG: hypothetical protein A3F92_01000 [Candidatus Rokubacteria bacterium RIFCSPLOWO2_12_FULL_71_22]|nr:MAG: hypothetical protein A3F92_01000 [Candidatus Rokubacteria bacterium RIFCSPLOWO2_12_FULL_71_22]
MIHRIARLHPFTTRAARNLAVLFGVVYFAQVLWTLPAQALTMVLRERFGFSATQVATFRTLGRLPWLLKPAYGLLSDLVPLFGRRRKSYFLLASPLTMIVGLSLALLDEPSYRTLAALFVVMGFGLAFTDVLTDALMVERGRVSGLTGAFQAVQWAAAYAAAVLVGVVGGRLAETRSVRLGFLLSAGIALVSFVMAVLCIKEPASDARAARGEMLAGVKERLRDREIWLVAGFLFLWAFSPSIGTALFYYQTDVLGFGQTTIGNLNALGSVAGIVGAAVYAPLSRGMPLTRLLHLAIALGVAGTLVHLAYGDPFSAVVITVVFGATSMVTFLAFLDLAARACPRRVEGTFFALLTAVYNGGTQASDVVGSYLYDSLGYDALVLISTATSALVWPLLPLVRIDRIEARALEEAAQTALPSSRIGHESSTSGRAWYGRATHPGGSSP